MRPRSYGEMRASRKIAGFFSQPLTLERFNRLRQTRFGAGGHIGVDYVVGCGPVELLYESAKFGLAFLKLLGRDCGPNLAYLRTQARLGRPVPSAANDILPHAFFGAGCIGHDWKL